VTFFVELNGQHEPRSRSGPHRACGFAHSASPGSPWCPLAVAWAASGPIPSWNFCRQGHRVTLFLSPASGQAYNKAADPRPARAGRPGVWRHEDMERAAFLSNHLPRRGGQSPQARWDARAAITPEARAAFLETLEAERPKVLEDLGLSGKSELSTREQRQVERHSFRRALVACGFLSFRRRTIPLQQKSQKADTR
jgi:hypothetical protein